MRAVAFSCSLNCIISLEALRAEFAKQRAEFSSELMTQMKAAKRLEREKVPYPLLATSFGLARPSPEF